VIDPAFDSSAQPIAEGLFTWPESPHLIGGSCVDCGTTTFPKQSSCPRCTGSQMREVPLATRGTLWTWTIQGFEPKPPYAGEGPFEPYGVGYVEVASEAEGASPVLVETRLSEHQPERLRIGDEMELAIVPFRHDAEGRQLVTFSFRPVG
ncbi:MAG TPA: OB-fold domain-containing protein, partial [Acidimicrobiales bacterium]|nr:OB-fold domain-containing protein [Acidimicrobiales bacterium]